MTTLIHRGAYELPDGTPVVALVRLGRAASIREWAFYAPSGDPMYLLSRDGRRLLRFVLDPLGAGRRYLLAPCDMQLDDVRPRGDTPCQA